MVVINTSTYNQQILRRVYSDNLQAAVDAGVFVSTRCLLPKKETFHTMPASSSSTLSSGIETTSGSQMSTHVSMMSWKSSGSSEHNRDSPLLVSNPDLGEEPPVDQAKCLGHILARSRNLPKSGRYCNNHVMVNQERIKRTAAPLIRMHELDEAARAHAEAMAKESSLFHMDPDGVLRASLKDRPCRRLGENVAKGKTIREIHQSMMQTIAQKNNILDRRFTHMGMATARGTNGELYMCQVFRG